MFSNVHSSAVVLKFTLFISSDVMTLLLDGSISAAKEGDELVMLSSSQHAAGGFLRRKDHYGPLRPLMSKTFRGHSLND